MNQIPDMIKAWLTGKTRHRTGLGEDPVLYPVR